ncbi:hypothetical protein IMZ48_41630 [Candidatus Bathyarchaeota archaeon]|nr:hypothetical protein [Candidatus Bathyarchaeota archaeon]
MKRADVLGTSYRHDPTQQLRRPSGTALRTFLAGPERQSPRCAPRMSQPPASTFILGYGRSCTE